jgi:integrase
MAPVIRMIYTRPCWISASGAKLFGRNTACDLAIKMAIRKYYVNSPREGYQLDRKTGQYFSWGFDIWVAGERMRERGLPTRLDAEKAIAQLKENARNERLGIRPPVDAPKLIELFQAKLDATSNAKDRARAKRVMKHFLSLLPPRIRVTELRSAHIQTYIADRTASGVSAATIRRELVPVVSALNSAGSFFESLESYRPPKIQRPKIAKTRKSRVITPEELRLILQWLFDPANDKGRGLRRRVGLLLQLCILTASRPGEIANLKRGDVDLGSMLLRVEGTKTRFESTAGLRHLNISPTIEKILRERLEIARGDFLFTSSGRITANMYKALKAACQAVGLEYGKEVPYGITFSRGRHTGITNMLKLGVDLQTIGEIAGHSNSTMTMHYAHGDPEAKKQAVFGLDQQFNLKQSSQNPVKIGKQKNLQSL